MPFYLHTNSSFLVEQNRNVFQQDGKINAMRSKGGLNRGNEGKEVNGEFVILE
jgi:hypothetical protein